MTSVLFPAGAVETLANLLAQLGGISPERVRFRPLPGTATEQDAGLGRNTALYILPSM